MVNHKIGDIVRLASPHLSGHWTVVGAVNSQPFGKRWRLRQDDPEPRDRECGDGDMRRALCPQANSYSPSHGR
jgi:hypothetical protein